MSTPSAPCPTCQRAVAWSDTFPFRPFCSERCRMVDLGAWFAEERKIAGDAEQEFEAGGPSGN